MLWLAALWYATICHDAVIWSSWDYSSLGHSINMIVWNGMVWMISSPNIFEQYSWSLIHYVLFYFFFFSFYPILHFPSLIVSCAYAMRQYVTYSFFPSLIFPILPFAFLSILIISYPFLLFPPYSFFYLFLRSLFPILSFICFSELSWFWDKESK